jgi:hypothetical protein
LKKIKRSFDSGQDLVEFAITSFLLLMIVMVIFDLGRAVYYYSALDNAVREGARYGIVFPDDLTGIHNEVHGFALGLNLDAAQPQISFMSSYADPGNPTYDPQQQHSLIKVCASYTYTAATPFVRGILGSQQITLNNCSTMKLEY